MQKQVLYEIHLCQKNNHISNTNACILSSSVALNGSSTDQNLNSNPAIDAFVSEPTSICPHAVGNRTFTRTQGEVKFRYSQVLLSSSLRQAGSNGLICCNFCAKITWILGTKEAGGLCTLCSSAVSIHSIGSRAELSLGKSTAQLGLEVFHTNFSPADEELLEPGQEQSTSEQTTSTPSFWYLHPYSNYLLYDFYKHHK